MKVKTSELEGAALDWAVAVCNGIPKEEIYFQKWSGSLFRRNRDEEGNLNGTITTGPDLLFSRKWEAAGSIIDREGINVVRCNDLYFPKGNEKGQHWEPEYKAFNKTVTCYGQTYLIAAMRCYVTSKLGNELEIPDELVQ